MVMLSLQSVVYRKVNIVNFCRVNTEDTTLMNIKWKCMMIYFIKAINLKIQGNVIRSVHVQMQC